MGCTLQRGRFRLWKSSTSGCIRSRGDAKLSFLSLPSPMVPWQCETSTKQRGQKKHFENPRHNLVCATTRTYSICSEFYMLDLNLFLRLICPLSQILHSNSGPLEKNIKFSWNTKTPKICQMQNGEYMHVGRICKHWVSFISALSHPASTSQTTGRWRKFCLRTVTPAAPLPMLTESPVAVQEKLWKLKYPLAQWWGTP